MDRSNGPGAVMAQGPSISRYARQIVLPEVGEAGQSQIGAASAVVVGAGGLGCAVLPYLCAAGVGRIVIVDHDRVEESNLHRQPLYRGPDIGKLKAEVAQASLLALNPLIRVQALCERLTPANAPKLVAEADIVVDAADSFAVTYILSDECARTGKPLVSASVIGLSGYVGAFCGVAPSYRAVFPELPQQTGTCATQGVLGTAVGVVGTLQSQLVLSLLLDLKPSVAGRLIRIDLRTIRFSEFSFMGAREEAGGFRFVSTTEVTEDDVAVELRPIDEAPIPAVRTSVRVPMEEVERLRHSVPTSTRIVLCCRTGLRAWRAGNRLRAAGHENVVLLAAGE
jgi:sulfur-carrier protein adenylyltransferase/sulfurtransferase